MVQTNYKQRGKKVMKTLEKDEQKKEKKITLKEIFGKKMKERLNRHSKKHEGGMEGKHMKNMVRFIKKGMTFEEAHQKAVELDDIRRKEKPVKKRQMKQMKKVQSRY